LKKFMKIAEGPTVEGPSALQVGDEYIVYFDRYRDPKRDEAAASNDLAHWTSAPARSASRRLQSARWAAPQP
jgi:hypothetical protein